MLENHILLVARGDGQEREGIFWNVPDTNWKLGPVSLSDPSVSAVPAICPLRLSETSVIEMTWGTVGLCLPPVFG